MARKWKDGDSARKMVQKYNETVEDVIKLENQSSEVIDPLNKKVDELSKEVDKKLESVSREDLDLDKVDNTSDMEKPVSTAQAQAIRWAKEEAMTNMITSEPISGEPLDSDSLFITSIGVKGTKLIIGV